MTAFDSATHRATDPGADRFCRLTYTSYTLPATVGAAGRSGWQVKDRSPGLTDAEQQLLVGWVSTNLDPVTPIPQYPTPDDIAALPRRLTYARLDAAQAVYCHTVPAGADAAGRPGNVFAHILFDRQVDPFGPRPIELWRSPDWLTPFGQTKIANAALDPARERVRPGGSIDRASVLHFLLGPQAWRIGVFRVLLDAVEQCLLRDGPCVVLAVEDPDSAALWIGAVSFFMAVTTAATLNWTTFERANAVTAGARRGMHLVAVPAQDGAILEDTDRVLVIDATQPIRLGEFGRSPHRTQHGVPVPVSEWSMLAVTILLSYDIADQALNAVDSIANRMGWRTLTPSWPLAMVVARNPRLRDATEEARLVIDRDSPKDLDEDPDLYRSVLSVLVPTLGHTAEDAWNALGETAADTAGVTREVIWKTFVERALQDPDWLGREKRSYDTRFVPVTGRGAAELRTAAGDAAAAQAQRARAASRDLAESMAVARGALRMTELLVSANLIDAEIEALLREALGNVLRPLLHHHGGGTDFVSASGSIDHHIRERFVLPAAVPDEPTVDQPLGRRFAPAVAGWLMGTSNAGFDALRREPRLIETGLYQVISDAVFEVFTTADAHTRDRWAPCAPIGLWRALYEEKSSAPWPATDIGPLFEAAAWDTRELLAVDSQWPGMIPARFFRRPLLGSRSGEELGEFARRIGDRAPAKARFPLTGTPSRPELDEAAFAWARLITRDWRLFRKADIASWWALAADYEREPGARLPAPLDTRFAVVYIVLRSEEFRPGAPPFPVSTARAAALAGAVTENWERVVDALISLIDHGLLDAYWVCAIAVMADPDAPSSSVLSPDDPLRAMRDPLGITVFEHVAADVLHDPLRWSAPADQESLVEAVREQASATPGERYGYAADGLERFARTWRVHRDGAHPAVNPGGAGLSRRGVR